MSLPAAAAAARLDDRLPSELPTPPPFIPAGACTPSEMTKFLQTLDDFVGIFKQSSPSMSAGARESAVVSIASAMAAASSALTQRAATAPPPNHQVPAAAASAKRRLDTSTAQQALSVLKHRRVQQRGDDSSVDAMPRGAVVRVTLGDPVKADGESWLHRQGAVEAIVEAANGMESPHLVAALFAAVKSTAGRRVGALAGSVPTRDIQALADALPSGVTLLIVCDGKRHAALQAAHLPLCCQLYQYKSLETALLHRSGTAVLAANDTLADVCARGAILLLLDVDAVGFDSNGWRLPTRALVAAQAQDRCLTLAHFPTAPNQEKQCAMALHMLLAPQTTYQSRASVGKGAKRHASDMYRSVCAAAGLDASAAFGQSPSYLELMRGPVGAALGLAAAALSTSTSAECSPKPPAQATILDDDHSDAEDDEDDASDSEDDVPPPPPLPKASAPSPPSDDDEESDYR